MKRPILLILVCFLFFSVFTACDDKENDSSISSSKNTTTSSRPNTTTYVSSETKTLDPEKDYLIYATDPCPLIKNILHRGMGVVAPECTKMAVDLYKMGVTGFCNDSLNIGKALREAGHTW